MGWHIDVMDNQLGLSVEQAEKLVDLLEENWSEYAMHLDAHGDKQSLVDMFSGERIEFDYDCMEHMDYLHDAAMQAAFIAVGARGFVTLGDFQGDSRGYAWTHEFTEAGYSYGCEKVAKLNDGKVPVQLVTANPSIGASATFKPTLKDVPYGWHFELVHTKSGEVFNEGFSKTDISAMAEQKHKIKGLAYRVTPLFTG